MKKIITLLLAVVMVLSLAACSSTNKQGEGSEESASNLPDHYVEARYFNADGTLATVDHYSRQGHMLSDEVYDGGQIACYEEFRPTDAYTDLDVSEIEDNADVASIDFRELFIRSGEDGSEFASANMVYVFGYDKNDRMNCSKVFIFNEDGSLQYDYLVKYDVDELGNFTGWTHTTDAGDVLFKMVAENTYDGEQLTGAVYHYTRYGHINVEDNSTFLPQDAPTEYALTLEFDY